MEMMSLRALMVKAILTCAYLITPLQTVEAKRGAKYFTNYTVTSHTGQSFKFYDDLIKDRIVIINFIYTTCTDICGLQSARMALVQEYLGDRLGKDIFIYSISIDPDRDTARVLKDYASAFNPKPGWLSLTGKSSEIHHIRFKLGERSRKLSEHQNYAVLGNGRTGEWGRTSMMRDIKLLAKDILDMDPNHRNKRNNASVNSTGFNASRLSRQLANNAGQALFIKACAACHEIGGGTRIGPDLAGVTERRRLDWLKKYISQPTKLRTNKDPIALALRRQYKNVVMPYLGLDETDAAEVIAYIRSQTLNRRLSGQRESSK